MKQVLTSAGLLALGAASVHAYDPDLTRQKSGRPFTVAATVRAFYDDNINTAASDKARQESYGFQLSPSIHVNLPLEQTFLNFGYIYTLNWYENRDPNRIDQSHEFGAKLRHQFSPTHTIGVDDSFVITSEPTVVDRNQIITDPSFRQRSRSSVFQNRANIDDNIGITRLFSLSLGYGNNWYDYQAEGDGSRSALLDRIEHTIRADGRYLLTPKLVGIVGYTFSFTTFTGDEYLDQGGAGLKSDSRNSLSHYAYVGADYDVTAKLRASARIGGQFTEYHKIGESSVSPYADASLSYSILSGTSLEAGVRHARNATDVNAVDTSNGRPTLDAETTALYAQLQHRITYKLTAHVTGQYQMSTFNDGLNDGSKEDLWLFGVNLEYAFNRHLSAEVGYNYDQLNTDLSGRGYDRNRVYVGLRATY